MKQVKVPKEFPWKRRRIEFQQGKDPARLKDSVDFRKALGAIGKVTQSEGKGSGGAGRAPHPKMLGLARG